MGHCAYVTHASYHIWKSVVIREFPREINVTLSPDYINMHGANYVRMAIYVPEQFYPVAHFTILSHALIKDLKEQVDKVLRRPANEVKLNLFTHLGFGITGYDSRRSVNFHWNEIRKYQGQDLRIQTTNQIRAGAMNFYGNHDVFTGTWPGQFVFQWILID